MTSDQLWVALCVRNPNFREETVTIKTESLRKLLEQAHRVGVEDGKKEPKPRIDIFSAIFK
jgi:hypothetical protein